MNNYPYGAYRNGRGHTLVPKYYTDNGEVCSFETIIVDKDTGANTKRPVTGARSKETYITLGCPPLVTEWSVEAKSFLCTTAIPKDAFLMISEGWATGCTIHEATNQPVFVSFGAGQLKTIALWLRLVLPDNPIIICGDWGVAGLKLANEAAQAVNLKPDGSVRYAVNGRVILPASEFNNDFNDEAKANGLAAVSAQLSPDVLLRLFDEPVLVDEPKDFLVMQSKGGKLYLAPASKARRLIQDRLGCIYRHDAGHWYKFVGTHFSQLSKDGFSSVVLKMLDIGCGGIGWKSTYFNDILMQLQLSDNGLPTMKDCIGVMPFQNGLLNIHTGELKPATPLYALTYVLPHDYNKDAKCPTITSWLVKALDGDKEMYITALICLAAVFNKRGDLQKFLYLIGPAGSGKGTYLRLARALVGARNVCDSSMQRIEKGTYELARFKDKHAVFLNDAATWNGSVENLTKLTGGDPISSEEKYVQATVDFIFDGLILITSNNPFKSSGALGGIARRMFTLSFDVQATDEERADWDRSGGEVAVLHSEIPGLVNLLLKFSRDEVRAGLNRPPIASKTANFDAILNNSSVAQWLVEECVLSPNNKAHVGVGERMLTGSVTTYANSETHLYPSYLLFCSLNGVVSKGKNNFTTALRDVCQALKLPIATGGRTNAGSCVEGIKLKMESYKNDFHEMSIPEYLELDL